MDKSNVNNATGFRKLKGMHIATVRHLAETNEAQVQLEAIGYQWPSEIGRCAGRDPLIAWRSPSEKLIISTRDEELKAALSALEPGKSETMVATNLSEAFSVHELFGSHIDNWMSHLVDALSIPTHINTCSRTRMADIPILLIRMKSDKMWLLSDSAIEHYVNSWLTFSFSGAFLKVK
jgi:hypothetical protein